MRAVYYPDVIQVIRQGMPGPWPREAQAWRHARCGRRSWSPTSSAKALAARGAGLAPCEMREAKLEPDVISQGIGCARRRPGRRWHIGAFVLQASLSLSLSLSHTASIFLSLSLSLSLPSLSLSLSLSFSISHSLARATLAAARPARAGQGRALGERFNYLLKWPAY